MLRMCNLFNHNVMWLLRDVTRTADNVVCYPSKFIWFPQTFQTLKTSSLNNHSRTVTSSFSNLKLITNRIRPSNFECPCTVRWSCCIWG